MYWRLHQAIFKDRIIEAKEYLSKYPDIVQVIQGHVWSADNPLVAEYMPALALTTIQDIRNIQTYKYTPWFFYHNTNYSVSYWMSYLPNIDFLNKQSMFIPCGLLKTFNKDILSSTSNEGKIFIRPNSGNKLFAGCVIELEDFEHEVNMIINKLSPENMVVISPYKKLHPVEWRFWIVNNHVIAYTPYSWEEDLEWKPAPFDALVLAHHVALSGFQIDATYVVDIVSDVNNKFYINEINATSTSGVYNVPFDKFFHPLRELSLQEYNNLYV